MTGSVSFNLVLLYYVRIVDFDPGQVGIVEKPGEQFAVTVSGVAILDSVGSERLARLEYSSWIWGDV